MATRQVSSVEAGQAYLELHHRMYRVLDHAMTAAGLSAGRAKVLVRLAKDGPMNQAKLAGLLGFAPRSVTDVVDALERDGLVTRGNDPNDRRARILALTPDGEHAYETAVVVRQKVMDEIFGPLSPSERATLVSLLSSIRTNLSTSGDVSCEQ